MHKPILFIHCGNSGSGKCYPIMEEYFEYIDKSGCKDLIDIKIFSTGGTKPTFVDANNHCFDYGMGEFYTLGNMKTICNSIDENVPIGYVQTKGEHNGHDNPAIIDWRNYMAYFAIRNMSMCIDSIREGFDAVGVDWHVLPNRHFSGNFWWSSSLYIKSLPEINPPKFSIIRHNNSDWSIDMQKDGSMGDRHSCEFWIGINNPKVKCLHSSGIDIYNRQHYLYPEMNYK